MTWIEIASFALWPLCAVASVVFWWVEFRERMPWPLVLLAGVAAPAVLLGLVLSWLQDRLSRRAAA